jgi:hypothetical protein
VVQIVTIIVSVVLEGIKIDTSIIWYLIFSEKRKQPAAAQFTFDKVNGFFKTCKYEIA